MAKKMKWLKKWFSMTTVVYIPKDGIPEAYRMPVFVAVWILRRMGAGTAKELDKP